VGAMVGARGCVSSDVNGQLLDSWGATIAGTGIFTVAVAWQGAAALVAPPTPALGTSALKCGENLYPSEPQRRIVTATMRIGALRAQ